MLRQLLNNHLDHGLDLGAWLVGGIASEFATMTSFYLQYLSQWLFWYTRTFWMIFVILLFIIIARINTTNIMISQNFPPFFLNVKYMDCNLHSFYMQIVFKQICLRHPLQNRHISCCAFCYTHLIFNIENWTYIGYSIQYKYKTSRLLLFNFSYYKFAVCFVAKVLKQFNCGDTSRGDSVEAVRFSLWYVDYSIQ